MLAGKIKNTLSERKQNKLLALIPRDATLQVHICQRFGLWPCFGRGVKHKVNEVENMVRHGGWQAQGREVQACQSPP